jgi:diamine N-acetyltransferase
VITIQEFQIVDAASLAQLHNQLYPTIPHTAVSIKQHFSWQRQINGRCWVLHEADFLLGYGCISPIPGIHGLFEMSGGILPSKQRRGFGSHLLQKMITDLAGSDARQLSYGVTAIDSVPARFFRYHDFFLEHEEYHLHRTNLPLPPLPNTSCSLQKVGGETAVSQFLTYYRRSFAGTRWYQPFTRLEVSALLKNTDELLFLYCSSAVVGFVWLRYPEPQIAEIEPIGIVKAFQGQGYGRLLLHHTLHHLQTKEIQQVNLGVWADNTPARHLYHHFSFKHHATTTYLAYNL